MLQINVNNLFPPKTRKILIFTSAFISFICFNLLLHSVNDSSKILFLYLFNAFIMLLVISYKNSVNKYEIAIFAFFCVQLFAYTPAPDDMDILVSTSYLLSYRYGVSSRGLIATIVDFVLNGGFISKYFIWHFIYSSTIFITFIISVLIGAIIQNAKDEIKIFILFFSLLYLTCFTSLSAYYTSGNFGRTEIFAFLLVLAIAFIINKPIISWFIPLFTLFILGTHLVQLFFYIPLIIILLLYNAKELSTKNKQIISILIITIIVIITVFLLYVSFSRKTFTYQNAAELFAHLKTKTNLEFNEHLLHMTMFGGLEDHLRGWKNLVNLKYIGNISILMNVPLIIMFIIFWIKCIKAETEKINKFIFSLPAVIFIYHSFVFFLFYDFGRWMIMIMNFQFILVFYFIHIKNKTIISVAQSLNPLIKKYAFFIIIAYFIMITMEPIKQIGPSLRTMHIIKFLLTVIN